MVAAATVDFFPKPTVALLLGPWALKGELQKWRTCRSLFLITETGTSFFQGDPPPPESVLAQKVAVGRLI